MPSRYRFAASPRWVLGHAVVLVLMVTMTLLGRWQLDVSDAKHFSLQNFGYALQWWAFTTFALVMWLRIIRDVQRHNADETTDVQIAEAKAVAAAPVAYRRYVMPQSSDGPMQALDGAQAAYNDYLAQLNAAESVKQDSERTTS
ncbi:MAG: hypothetical protein ABI232_07010 [Jatrophihabitantaceae bacterium]